MEGGSYKSGPYIPRVWKGLNGSCLCTLCNLFALTESIPGTENVVTELLEAPKDKYQLQEVECSRLLAGW